jgi:ABC-2 type transport system ATP-binding protein
MSIEVNGLTKHFRVHQKAAGLSGSLRGLFKREYRTVKAVEDVTFAISEGEVVGFLGPNGAGKTTTLKCLAGLLYPTTGDVKVLGYTPHRREKDYLRRYTFVMGQRNQLLWDLPAMETFLVNQAIYSIPESQFRRALDEMVALLGIEELLKTQVRKLSLGERMKCELAASLLHRPLVLFLDEPTLGLDVTAQASIREFIKVYNQAHHATVLLTSHYMADVTALAARILVIDRGRLMYDGNLHALVEQLAPYRLLRLTLSQPVAARELEALGKVTESDGLKVIIQTPRASTKEAAARALATLPVADVSVEDPPVEEIIREVFRTGLEHAEPA